MERPTCFVIQPYDEGQKFDKRYADTFRPALEAAGVCPVRTDTAVGGLDLIEAIDDGIRRAALCFIEVTTNNPNVWYELGYARALGKPLIIVSEKQDKYPFDVSHLRIITYRTDSRSDYEELKKLITARAKDELARGEARGALASAPALAQEGDLEAHVLTCLAAIASEQHADRPVDLLLIRTVMESRGFDPLATRVATDELVARQMIKSQWIPGYDDSVAGFCMTEMGVEWLRKNFSRLKLRAPAQSKTRRKDNATKPPDFNPDEPPF
ncbi:MAG: hypothetical protein IT463_12505 [Planctomycetes bacterium]|nr:hypothetical protein [Planctomycetota bacterium]